MTYPSRTTVIAPHFRVVDDDNLTGTHSHRLVFLEAFAALTVAVDDEGHARFHQQVQVDTAGDRSVQLLRRLTRPLTCETVLAGFRLDQVLGSLVRVPRDSEQEALAKTALLRLQLSLAQPPIDTWWMSSHPLLFLTAVAVQYGLPAKWQTPITTYNPLLCRQTLAARAQTMWAAIAADRMPTGDERRRVFADFDRWRTAAD